MTSMACRFSCFRAMRMVWWSAGFTASLCIVHLPLVRAGWLARSPVPCPACDTVGCASRAGSTAHPRGQCRARHGQQEAGKQSKHHCLFTAISCAQDQCGWFSDHKTCLQLWFRNLTPCKHGVRPGLPAFAAEQRADLSGYEVHNRGACCDEHHVFCPGSALRLSRMLGHLRVGGFCGCEGGTPYTIPFCHGLAVLYTADKPQTSSIHCHPAI